MPVDEDSYRFGRGYDYAVPPGPFGQGVIFVTETGALDPSVTITDQFGDVIYSPLPPTPAEAGGDIDYEFQGDNPLVPTPPGEPGPPSQPIYAGPPEIFQPGPPDQGGPEDVRTPPDFDVPLPREAPPGQPPATTPTEGEYIPRGSPPPPEPRPPIEGEYEKFERRVRKKKLPRIKNIPRRDIPAPPRLPPVPPIIRVPRLPGPAGIIMDAILNPSVLGGGPGIDEVIVVPPVSIPEPRVTLPEPTSPPTPAPAMPDFGRPDVPDVVVVTPTAPLPSFPAPRSSSTVPRARRVIWPALVGLASILRPIHRTTSTPSASFANFPAQETNPVTPLPRRFTDPLTPPLPTAGTDPLTPPRATPVPSAASSPFGPFGPMALKTDTEEKRCRCKKCKKCKENRNRKDPSDKIANVKVYRRRMSNWSLKNLNRGTRAGRKSK